MTNPNIHANEPTSLYRLYDAADQLLYVGIAVRPDCRWEQHASDKAWWHQVTRKTVEWHENRASALAAEAQATAEEKPLYDMSWRHTQEAPRDGFDDSEGKRAVHEFLTKAIEEGIYPPGSRLSTGTVSRECGVARTTASSVMHALAGRNGLLEHVVHGRYRVAER